MVLGSLCWWFNDCHSFLPGVGSDSDGFGVVVCLGRSLSWYWFSGHGVGGSTIATTSRGGQLRLWKHSFLLVCNILGIHVSSWYNKILLFRLFCVNIFLINSPVVAFDKLYFYWVLLLVFCDQICQCLYFW